MTIEVEHFISLPPIAVAGVSSNRNKYGNICYRFLRDRGIPVYAIHPQNISVEGDPCYPNIASLPTAVTRLLSVIPSARAAALIAESIYHGVEIIWFQPGAEALDASKMAEEAGIEVIDDGSCIMVALSLMTVTSSR